MISKRLSSERYRLRAEELRVIASEVRQGEYRRFLLEIAADYDRMAQSAEVIMECRESLAHVSGQLTAPPVVVEAKAGDAGQPKAKIQAYRAMAADAERLSSHAERDAREAWLQLSQQWNSLAENLERQPKTEGEADGEY